MSRFEMRDTEHRPIGRTYFNFHYRNVAHHQRIIIIIIKHILEQVKQIIVTNALYYQLPERNMTVFKRLQNIVNDSELSAVIADGSAFQAAGQA